MKGRGLVLYRRDMVRLVYAVAFGGAMILQSAAPRSYGQEILPPSAPPPLHAGLPSIPKGNSTVIGGQIRAVDPVRDQFTLKVFGAGSVKILYDERTQVFRDSTQISVLDLQPDDHASVETTLDGTSVFAIRIHLMKQVPEGETLGRVTSYDAESGSLKVQAPHETISFQVPAATPIVRVGPLAASSTVKGSIADLTQGSLVDVVFKSGKGGSAIATRVDVVAVVGASFDFTGRLTTLDLTAGRLVLVGAKEDESQVVTFNPARFPVSKELREDQIVKVTATFDGTKYVANDIVVKR